MTKMVKVLGSESCKKCNVFKDSIEKIINENNFDAVVEKVNDIEVVMSYDVMSLPGLVIDEKVVSSGKILSSDELIKILKD